MTKKYEIEHSYLTWSCIVEIDEEKAAPYIKENIEFWSGWQDRLDEHDGDYTITFIHAVGRWLLPLVIERTLENAVQRLSKMEGWFALDGSCGVTVSKVNNYEFDDYEFSVTEVK